MAEHQPRRLSGLRITASFVLLLGASKSNAPRRAKIKKDNRVDLCQLGYLLYAIKFRQVEKSLPAFLFLCIEFIIVICYNVLAKQILIFLAHLVCVFLLFFDKNTDAPFCIYFVSYVRICLATYSGLCVFYVWLR